MDLKGFPRRLTSDEIGRAVQVAIRSIEMGLPAYLQGRVFMGTDVVKLNVDLDVGVVLDPRAFHRFIMDDGSVNLAPLAMPHYRDELMRLAELEKETNEIKLELPLREES